MDMATILLTVKGECLSVKLKNYFTSVDVVSFLCFVVLTAIICFGTVGAQAQKENLADNVIRLHVLANSDDDADIDLKYQVRDELIKLSSGLFYSGMTRSKAVEVLQNNKQRISQCVQSVLDNNNISYGFEIIMDDERYPVRRYGDFLFPKGEYLSLRVKLGKAEGTNWWCVLFPPLCSDLASKQDKTDEELLQSFGFTQKQIDFLKDSVSESFYIGEAPKEKINVKIALVEFLRDVLN